MTVIVTPEGCYFDENNLLVHVEACMCGEYDKPDIEIKDQIYTGGFFGRPSNY